MKNKVFIILSLLAMSLFFTKMDVYAVEDNTTAPYTVDCYTIQHNFDKNGQESTSENWRVVLSSSSPVDLYYFTTFDTPFSGDYIVRAYAVSESPINDSGTVFDYQGKKLYGLDVCYIATGFYSGNSGYIDFFGNGANEIYKLKNSYGDVDSFIYDYKRDGLDYEISIDWNNAQLNMTIGYLKNVVLKMDSVNHKKFTVSWTTDEDLFMSDDWRIQIGFFTRFQKHLFGDKFIHTNLNYVTYDDELYYHLGKWQVNLDDVYDSIPDCNHPHYKGNFYLRLVHVDTSTGLVEFGPWGQLSWHLNQGNTEGLADITSEYKTIESSNVIEKEGTFDLIEEEYIVDTTHPDSQDYVINADKGTIGTEFGGIDFSDVDLSNIGNTFMNGMSALGDTLRNFPTLMSKVASFLPNEVVVLITIGFALVIALRIWGR